jgi:hypothetical protein
VATASLTNFQPKIVDHADRPISFLVTMAIAKFFESICISQEIFRQPFD